MRLQQGRLEEVLNDMSMSFLALFKIALSVNNCELAEKSQG